MKNLLCVSLSLLGSVLSTAVMAQEGVETTVTADVVNQYIWRGQDLGNASLQPTLGIAYKGLSLSAWGSVGITEASDTKEFDLTLAYTAGGFNVGVTDYWFNAGLDDENRYFRYPAHSTNHVYEANVGYDFGALSLQCYTNIAGNDGVNDEGKRAYSTYCEVAVPFTCADVEWSASVGAVPLATDFYGTTGFAVTNISLRASRSIPLSDRFSLPLFAQITANPCSQKAYFVFGVTL